MVEEMSDGENGITPKIGRKRSGQHKGTSNFQKVTIFSFSNPILLGGVSKGTLVYNSFRG